MKNIEYILTNSFIINFYNYFLLFLKLNFKFKTKIYYI